MPDANTPAQTPAEALVEERGKTHGPWNKQSACAREMKIVLMKYGGLQVPPSVAEALDSIAVKMSRIVCGDWREEDHYDDIGGYAQCAKADIPAIIEAIAQAQAQQEQQIKEQEKLQAKAEKANGS